MAMAFERSRRLPLCSMPRHLQVTPLEMYAQEKPGKPFHRMCAAVMVGVCWLSRKLRPYCEVERWSAGARSGSPKLNIYAENLPDLRKRMSRIPNIVWSAIQIMKMQRQEVHAAGLNDSY